MNGLVGRYSHGYWTRNPNGLCNCRECRTSVVLVDPERKFVCTVLREPADTLTERIEAIIARIVVP